MTDIKISLFKEQDNFVFDQSRICGAFAGKRGGKTESGAIKGVVLQEQKPNYMRSQIDPYLGVIIAPTYDMLNRLSWKKFRSYARPFLKKDPDEKKHFIWHDNSEILGISADKPSRLEGLKANWIWIDEIFQCKEQIFLESLARVSDQQGYVFCTGSLGVQYVNPKAHWCYKYFVERPLDGSSSHTWNTLKNPYFPREEIDRLKKTLDAQTFKSMFEINWDTVPLNAVYGNFSEDNIISNYRANPSYPVYASIDWGFAHDMAIGFFQVINDVVYMFDEIVLHKMTLDKFWQKYHDKFSMVQDDKWDCDIAGKQTREQTGISNIQEWVEIGKKYGKHIKFSYRKTEVTYGIPIVRSYIKSATGLIRFYIDASCSKTIDQIKAYRYPEKDGIIVNENPVKENDDACDMLRYFFVNFVDPKGQWKPARISHY